VLTVNFVVVISRQSYIERGVHRRVAAALQLSHVAALHTAVLATMECERSVLLRDMPALVHQLQDVQDSASKEQLDFQALNMKLFATFSSALPRQAEAITTQFNELPEATMVDVMGKLVSKWGSEGSADGQLKRPSGVAVSDGLVYVADSDNHRIQVFSASDGSSARTWGSEGSANGQLKNPQGVAVSGGLVYVSNGHRDYRRDLYDRITNGTYDAHLIQVFNASDGSFVRKWGSERDARGRSGPLINPWKVAVSDGLVYAAGFNHCIQVFNASDGSFVRAWGSEGSTDGQLKNPQGVAVSGGLLYVADKGNHRIQVFNASDGKFVRRWGSFGAADGQLQHPLGVVVSGGLVYVADSSNHRIQVFSASDGNFLGKWGSEGSADGQLKNPDGVAVSGGLVYVADQGNHRIQVFRC
jgi:tripartite motif-containing protein 71